MDRYLKISFDNVKGRNCESCMVSFYDGKEKHCAALSNEPICAKKECRPDCPLIENVIELPIIDITDWKYQDAMSYGNCLVAKYTRNDYRDLLKTKSKEDLLQIKDDIKGKIEDIRVLHEGLLQKQQACEDILEG